MDGESNKDEMKMIINSNIVKIYFVLYLNMKLWKPLKLKWFR